ncbi:MAG: hypothetical protein ACD_19C00182G0014 [uncultured bacterium]|nr:MAG: hypothetical protein ACD_19C00182G0014 [uncultured bacterium]
MDHYAKAHFIFSKIKGGKLVIKMIESLRRFDIDEVAKQRLKIINFYMAHGEKACKEAFGADRKVISRWKQRLKTSKGSLASLTPNSTRPINIRTPRTRIEIVEFIKNQRETYFRIGKENLGTFDQQLKTDNIPHYFTYPHCPKIDSFIERYNRTLQNDIIDPYLDTIHNKGVFGEKLTEFNIYYNSQRPHHSLNKMSPLQYFISEGQMSHMSLTYTNT